MSKDPAFLFYYQDFMYGTRRFTREQRGLYIELLCEQADSKTGSIATDDFDEIIDCDYADAVIKKFRKDKNGWYNPPLRERMEKRKAYTESRRKNLESKKESKNNVSMESHMDDHKESHMENENRNRDKNEFIEGARKFYESEFLKLTDKPSRSRTGYFKFIGTLFNTKEYKNDLDRPLIEFLSMEEQLTFEGYEKIREAAKKHQVNIYTILKRMINDPKYTKGKKSIYLLFMDWIGREPLNGTNL